MPKPCAPSSVGTTAHNTSPYLTLARIRFVPGWLWKGGGIGWPRVALAPILVKPMRANASALFRATFGVAPHAAASAPGRVNLIGEHTDYNGGPVLPVACAVRTSVAVGPTDRGVLELISTRDGQVARINYREGRPQGWGAYIAGVMRELVALGAAPLEGGARVAVTSDVPVAAGLASSAALTVAAAKALSLLAGARLLPRQLAGVAFRAEHDHVGVRCGIMDQMSRARARARFAAQPLARRQLKRFGALLYESHESCRRLYDCSTPELNTIVAAARRAGALGARLTGAGWGGAVLVLLAKTTGKRGKHEAKVVREIQQAFRAAYARDPAISTAHPSGGVRRGQGRQARLPEA